MNYLPYATLRRILGYAEALGSRTHVATVRAFKPGDQFYFLASDIFLGPSQPQMVTHAQYLRLDRLKGTARIVPIAYQRPLELPGRRSIDTVHLNVEGSITQGALAGSRIQKDSESYSLGVAVAGRIDVQSGSLIVESDNALNVLLATTASRGLQPARARTDTPAPRRAPSGRSDSRQAQRQHDAF